MVSLDRDLARELGRLTAPERVLQTPEDLHCYSYDGTGLEERPSVVASPKSTAEVARVVKLAHQRRIPLVTRGAGTGLSGGSIPTSRAIVLNLAMMNRIKEIDETNLVAVVEPGVVTATLQAAAERRRLFYPPDPASLKQSTLGGNVAECAGGPRCLKYGVTKDYVLGLEVVLADGQVIRTGGKSVKNVTGYNLTQLFVGSEGTLGVVTEIILRLIPLPPAKRTAMAVFASIDQASEAVSAIFTQGILPATIEMMDNTTIRTVEELLRMGLPVEAEAILLIEADGDLEGVRRQIQAVEDVCRAAGATSTRVAHSAAENEQLWTARRAVSPSLARLKPNKLGEDVAVPRGMIPAMVRRIGEIARRHDVIIAIFGHAGDGNLHPNILYDKRNPDEVERVELAAADIFASAVELGGTLSGEHGIGLAKKEFMPLALSPETLGLMRTIKATLDPYGILNPGKVFPSGQGPALAAGLVASGPDLTCSPESLSERLDDLPWE